jgi:hypothetical protein
MMSCAIVPATIAAFAVATRNPIWASVAISARPSRSAALRRKLAGPIWLGVAASGESCESMDLDRFRKGRFSSNRPQTRANVDPRRVDSKVT